MNGYITNACEAREEGLQRAVLSVLTTEMISQDRIDILPPSYCYPCNLHAMIPEDRLARVMTDLVSVVYEDRPLRLGALADIEVREPLRSWLETRTGGQ